MRLFKKKVKAEYWEDLMIPASLFFYNLGKDDLSYLTISGKPTEEQLTKAYDAIYDAYFDKRASKKSRILLQTRNKIAVLILKIETVKTIIKFAVEYPLTDDLRDQLIKGLIKAGVRIKDKESTKDVIIKVTEQYLPSWDTELKIEKGNLKDEEEKEVISYEKSLETISDIKNRHYPDDMSLKRFLEAEKSAFDLNKKRAQEQLKNKRNGK